MKISSSFETMIHLVRIFPIESCLVSMVMRKKKENKKKEDQYTCLNKPIRSCLQVYLGKKVLEYW